MITSIESEKRRLAYSINVPLFLLVVLDKDGKVYEVVTKQEIYYDYGYMLSVRECSKNAITKKYDSVYESNVKNFFNRKSFKVIEFSIQKVLKK